MTTKRVVLICGICLAASLLPAATRAQQDEPPRPRAPTWASLLAVGGYEQHLFNSSGGEDWSGFMVEGSFKPAGGGPWLASVTSFFRPRAEGNGAVLAVGKYLELGWGYAYLGSAAGWGASYLPLAQGTGDLDVAIGNSGLVFGGGVVFTEVNDHQHQDILGQLGPTLYALGSVFTCRFLLNNSNPGSNLSYGVLATARHGTSDREPWQSVTVTAGTEAYQIVTNNPSVPGTDVHNTGVHVTADVFQPLTQRHALRLTVDWGRKFDSYYLFGGTLRWVLLF